MVLYRSNHSVMEQMANSTPEQTKAIMDQWMTWSQRAGGAVVDMGAPLGDPKALGQGMPAMAGYVGGYSIVEAESSDAAAKLFGDHPHLQAPGGSSIEFLEMLPMREM